MLRNLTIVALSLLAFSLFALPAKNLGALYSVAITNLSDKANIRNNNAIAFDLIATVSPNLAPDASVSLWLDQQFFTSCKISLPQEITCKIQGVDRGAHVLQIHIQQAQQLVARSESIIVYFQQAHVRTHV